MAQTDVTVGRFSNGKITIEPNEVRSSIGTSYTLLSIPMELSFSKVEHVPQYSQGEISSFALLSVQAMLSVDPGSTRIADSIAIFDPLEFTNQRNVRSRYDLEFPLDPQRIRQIEERRRGNLILGLRFQLMVAHYEPIVIQTDNGPVNKNFVSRYERLSNQPEIRLEVPQSHWVKRILPALGIGEYFLIEIPKGKKTVQAAWDYLDKSESAFRNWNSKEVYANCRELGSLLDKSMKDKFGAGHFSYAIRWKRAYDGFNNLASWNLHLEDLKKSPSYSPDIV